MRNLIFIAGIAESIRAHGAETYPHECCGALVGRGDTVAALVPLPNTTEEGPRRRFLVRPSDYSLAERRASELDGELLGFYHSHPDHPARPSQYDLDHAWPNFAYVIVSVMGGGPLLDGTDSSPRGGERAAGGRDLTVWFLADDRSAFLEGTLNDGEHNPDPDAAPALHGQA